jgi:uncharacterized protein YdhG (YjbR/CyaY superfamily)
LAFYRAFRNIPLPIQQNAEKKLKSIPPKIPAAKTVDDYLAALSEDKRAALQRLRKLILAAAPGAEECISYQMPSFRYKGKVLVWFAAAKGHCAFYPGAVIEEFIEELKNFNTSKGTIRFQPEKPLPAALVRKLVRARIRRIERK